MTSYSDHIHMSLWVMTKAQYVHWRQVGSLPLTGSFQLGMNGSWTDAISWDAGQAALQTALTSLTQAPIAVDRAPSLHVPSDLNVTFVGWVLQQCMLSMGEVHASMA